MNDERILKWEAILIMEAEFRFLSWSSLNKRWVKSYSNHLFPWTVWFSNSGAAASGLGLRSLPTVLKSILEDRLGSFQEEEATVISFSDTLLASLRMTWVLRKRAIFLIPTTPVVWGFTDRLNVVDVEVELTWGWHVSRRETRNEWTLDLLTQELQRQQQKSLWETSLVNYLERQRFCWISLDRRPVVWKARSLHYYCTLLLASVVEPQSGWDLCYRTKMPIVSNVRKNFIRKESIAITSRKELLTYTPNSQLASFVRKELCSYPTCEEFAVWCTLVLPSQSRRRLHRRREDQGSWCLR